MLTYMVALPRLLDNRAAPRASPPPFFLRHVEDLVEGVICQAGGTGVCNGLAEGVGDGETVSTCFTLLGDVLRTDPSTACWHGAVDAAGSPPLGHFVFVLVNQLAFYPLPVDGVVDVKLRVWIITVITACSCETGTGSRPCPGRRACCPSLHTPIWCPMFLSVHGLGF